MLGTGEEYQIYVFLIISQCHKYNLSWLHLPTGVLPCCPFPPLVLIQGTIYWLQEDMVQGTAEKHLFFSGGPLRDYWEK